MLTDIEIAQQAKMLPITEVAKKLGIAENDIEMYGRYSGKKSWQISAGYSYNTYSSR